MDEKLKDYILGIIFATRFPEKMGLPQLKNQIQVGASPRATIALAKASRANAFIQHRGFVTPEDVKSIAYDVLRHRILVSFRGRSGRDRQRADHQQDPRARRGSLSRRNPRHALLPEELLRKVRRIEITTRKMVDDVMSGQYRSQFKGQGMQFSEHRLYVAGDDIRHIDWKVSARTRDPMIKKYEEERELTVFLVVDVSGSKNFGSIEKLKSEAAAEIAGMLAYAAMHTGDKVGALLFGGEVEMIIPPKKGKQHILAHHPRYSDVIRQKRKGTDLKGALEAAGRIMKHSGVVFVISDFIAQGYETALRRLARRHDVMAISVADPRERDVPAVGQLLLVDPETGKSVLSIPALLLLRNGSKSISMLRKKAHKLCLKADRLSF